MCASDAEPALRRLFEAIAAVMDLDEGSTRLELLFSEGRLTKWYAHNEARRPAELGRYDGRAAWLGARPAR
jgi:hypothetical protein